jgi:protein-L-isoaspartate(D-aspartate) O-methyltransferase
VSAWRDNGIRRMLDDIRAGVAATRSRIGRDRLDDRVMAAMAQVPRDEFVPGNMKSAAYYDGPLPIGHGQTISQPYIVALMTEMIAPQPHHRVLEIGTGSGYQTAVLSLLCDTVYSVDLIPDLVAKATERLHRLGYRNVATRSGNGYLGWPEHAPFDGILVTAAATRVPEALVDQLASGGRMAIPVGAQYAPQSLLLIEKDAEGEVTTSDLLPVAFVPLIDRSPEGRLH